MAPTWKNLLVNPAVRIMTDDPAGDGRRRARIHVTGLLCYSL